jgi:hypothetical protein
MSPSRVLVIALVAGAALIPTGCESREEYVMRLATEAPERKDPQVQELLHPVGEEVAFSNEVHIRRIAEARCAREQRCEQIGAGRRFADRDACMTYVLDHSRVDLSSAQCPGGIVEKELDECLQAIDEQTCGDPIDHAMRIVACRSSDMCKAIN